LDVQILHDGGCRGGHDGLVERTEQQRQQGADEGEDLLLAGQIEKAGWSRSGRRRHGAMTSTTRPWSRVFVWSGCRPPAFVVAQMRGRDPGLASKSRRATPWSRTKLQLALAASLGFLPAFEAMPSNSSL